MRQEGQRGHQGDAAQEEQNVTWIQLGKRPMKIYLVISPLKLAYHPQCTAQRDQHPEDVAPPVRCTGVEKQPGVGNQRYDTLDDVSKDD